MWKREKCGRRGDNGGKKIQKERRVHEIVLGYKINGLLWNG